MTITPPHVDNEVTRALYRLREQHQVWRRVAALLGIVPSTLSKILHGDRKPTEDVLRRLGFERRVDYVRVGR